MSNQPAAPAFGEVPPGFSDSTFSDECYEYIEKRKKALRSRVEETEKEIESVQKEARNEKVEELKEAIRNLEAAIKAYQDGTFCWGHACFQDGKQVQIPTMGKQWLTEEVLHRFRSKGANIDDRSQGISSSL